VKAERALFVKPGMLVRLVFGGPLMQVEEVYEGSVGCRVVRCRTLAESFREEGLFNEKYLVTAQVPHKRRVVLGLKERWE
jgi:hypothetical protein